MALTRLALENYRCFAHRQDIELRPITVVLGKNNSGKSALVRAPRIIATGIHTDAPVPYDLDQLGEDAPSFVDLIHNKFEHGNFTVELGLTDPRGSDSSEWILSVTAQNVADSDTQLVSEWKFARPDLQRHYSWVAQDDQDDSGGPRYQREDGEVVRTEFRGITIFPAVTAHPEATIHPDDVRRCYGEVRRLGPMRAPFERLTRCPNRMPKQDESGNVTTRILAYDARHLGGVHISKINDYLAAYLPGWEIEALAQGEAYSIGVRSKRNRSLWVPTSDAGTGLTQVLPLLLQRAIDEINPPDHDVLEIIEEPELHLHPPGQAGLADLYVRAIQLVPQTKFLIETHSELFLLRLRRRVAEGDLRPDQVALYFVEHDGESSAARLIDVNNYGEVDYWPEGVFSEDFEEVRKLADAQDRREADAR